MSMNLGGNVYVPAGPVAEAGAGAGAGGHGMNVNNSAGGHVVYVPPPAAAPAPKAPSRIALDNPYLKLFVVNKLNNTYMIYSNLFGAGAIVEEVGDRRWYVDKAGEHHRDINNVFNWLRQKIIEGDTRERVCKGAVNKSYFTRASKKDNNILFVFAMDGGSTTKTVRTTTTYDRNMEIIGFVLANQNPLIPTELYLDIICSELYGGKLLEKFLEYTKSLGITSVKLSSLAPVLTFYPKYGFKFRQSCAEPTDRIGLPESIRKKPMTEPNEHYGREDYMTFMMALKNNGLQAPLDEKIQAECTSAGITPARYQELMCDQNGFSMVRCLDAAGNPTLGGARNKKRRHTHRRRQAKRSKTRRQK